MERKYTGIILSKYDTGEADRIYTAYTLEMGKIKSIAQGVRKPQAKLAGHLENFVLADLTVIKKRGTGRITGSIVENNFNNLRNNLEALEYALKASDIFNNLVGMEERDEKIFNLLKQFLETLDKVSKDKKDNGEVLFYGFVFKLLEFLGYKLEVGACVNCTSPLSSEGNYFSAEKGGVVCKNCSPKIRNEAPQSYTHGSYSFPSGAKSAEAKDNVSHLSTISRSWSSAKADKIEIDNNAIKIIRIFSHNEVASLTKLKAGKKELDNIKDVLNNFLSWIA
ncbi:DNA repair protein RecO [bacterium BMS3Abin15]|nr:DNA repair protein RecO [bacterium BMS3Abin15]HDZ85903.1 DNA repair protein RecO [Candidatus Moranbacteria bacterium]